MINKLFTQEGYEWSNKIISLEAFLRCRETKLCHTTSQLWLFEAAVDCTIFYNLRRGKSAFCLLLCCTCSLVLTWVAKLRLRAMDDRILEYANSLKWPQKNGHSDIKSRTWSQGRISVLEEASFIGGSVSFVSNSKCKKSKAKFNTQL